MSMRNCKENFCRKGLKIFHLLSLWIRRFGVFDKHLEGCKEVKNTMGLQQGPGLMATKSPIQGPFKVLGLFLALSR